MNLKKLIKKHGGKWVALNENSSKVVASSKSAKIVYQKARESGFEVPLLYKVPTRDIPYIGYAVQI